MSKDTAVITKAQEQVLQKKHEIENEMAPSSPRRVTRAFSWSLAEMQRQYTAVPRDCSRPHKLQCLNMQCKRRRVPLLHAPVTETPAQRPHSVQRRRVRAERRKSKTAAADSNKLRTGFVRSIAPLSAPAQLLTADSSVGVKRHSCHYRGARTTSPWC